jgi:hypothetical protein
MREGREGFRVNPGRLKCITLVKRHFCIVDKFHNFPLLNSATSAAWRIDAPAAWVSVERTGAVLTVKNNAGIARLFQPCAARYSVKFNIIARVNSGAGPATVAGEFCAHAFNCHFVPLKELIILAK